MKWPCLLGVLSIASCDGGSSATTPRTESATPSVAATPKDGPAEPTPEPASEEIREQWLVWFDTGAGVRTRWYTTTDAGTTRTVERAALALSDGDALWHVRRADRTVDVLACSCLEDENDPTCARQGTVAQLGLEAVPADGGVPVSLVGTADETLYGEVDAMTLSLSGGVGPRLIVTTTDGGYYCGAHGSYGGATTLVDPSVAEPPKWPTVVLPDPLLRQAAVDGEMLESYQECWDEPDLGMGAFIRDHMRIAGVRASLDRGMVKLRWGAEADGPYVCTGDYAFHGNVESGLLPQGSTLGLSGPLSPGLKAAMADVGSAEVIGWSKLEHQGPARERALKWLGGLDETPWPPPVSEQKAAKAEPSPTARALLEKGRKLTRAKDYPGAVTALTAAIEAASSDEDAARPRAARCYAHLLAGSLKDARADCEAVLSLTLAPRFEASVHYNLGQVAEREGKTSQARAAYERSLALREHATVRRALDALR